MSDSDKQQQSSVSVEWRNLTFSFGTKKIFSNVDGSARVGELTCILGGSGVGKTTLLNMLADRVPADKRVVTSGTIVFGGQERSQISDPEFRRLAGYVMQQDWILETLTCRENLQFAGLLRLPSQMEKAAKLAKITEIESQLVLEECANVMTMNLSGGQRKRLSIGMELITDPSVLFLDEPTSGLDSFSARAVIRQLRAMAVGSKRTILCTIHQPSSDVFALFDRVLVLGKGGVVYWGSRSMITPYFADIGFSLPAFLNPADVCLTIVQSLHSLSHLSIGSSDSGHNVDGSFETEGHHEAVQISANSHDAGSSADVALDEIDLLIRDKQHLDFVAMFAKWSAIHGCNTTTVKCSARPSTTNTVSETVTAEDGQRESVSQSNATQNQGAKSSTAHAHHELSLIAQTLLLMKRNILSSSRNRFVVRARLAQTLFLSLIVGLIFLQLDTDQKGVQNREGALFLTATAMIMSGITSCLFVFPREKRVFLREYASGSYSSLSFFLSKAISDLPFQIIFPCLYGVIVYWMVGFQDTPSKFFTFLGGVILLSNVGSSVGFLLAVSAPDPDAAISLLPFVMISAMVFGGLFINTSSVPVYFLPFQMISYIKWGFEGLSINEFEGLVLHCKSSQIVYGQFCPVTSGEQVLDSLAFDSSTVALAFGILLAEFFVFRILSFLVISVIVRRQYTKRPTFKLRPL
eukprot:ANDGO_04254.mRNA.1 ABC transporter G family member 1